MSWLLDPEEARLRRELENLESIKRTRELKQKIERLKAELDIDDKPPEEPA